MRTGIFVMTSIKQVEGKTIVFISYLQEFEK